MVPHQGRSSVCMKAPCFVVRGRKFPLGLLAACARSTCLFFWRGLRLFGSIRLLLPGMKIKINHIYCDVCQIFCLVQNMLRLEGYKWPVASYKHFDPSILRKWVDLHTWDVFLKMCDPYKTLYFSGKTHSLAQDLASIIISASDNVLEGFQKKLINVTGRERSYVLYNDGNLEHIIFTIECNPVQNNDEKVYHLYFDFHDSPFTKAEQTTCQFACTYCGHNIQD